MHDGMHHFMTQFPGILGIGLEKEAPIIWVESPMAAMNILRRVPDARVFVTGSFFTVLESRVVGQEKEKGLVRI